MRLFPFLSKAPKYKRFNFEPRYYDAAKEEMDHRKSRIKKELEAEQRGETTNPMLGDGTLQPGAFRQARSHQKEPVMDTATLGRAVLIVILGGACLGYVFYGVNALYIGGLALVSYIYFRIRKG